MDLDAWLRGLGLGEYQEAFRDNKIDAGLLRRLTSDDLKEIGVLAVGDRRRLLDAIAMLDPTDLRTLPDRSEPSRSVIVAQAERRQLTIMFVDMVGSTALAATLDPEEWRQLLRSYQAAVANAIGLHGGHVAKYLGDGVLGYFGFPQAHEDDAERAIRAGLDAVAASAALGTGDGQRLAARVGIATGVVVVGDLIGEGAAREETVVGDTPNLAARLQAQAERGEVVIAESTRQLVGGLFECHDLGPTIVRGLPEPVRTFRVLRAVAAESRFEALHGADTPLVGRAHEVELLLGLWRRAAEGQGGVVQLSGEPGIGKSRLIAEFRQRLAGGRFIEFGYQCAPNRGDSAFHPLIAQLERAAGLVSDDSDVQKLAKLETLLSGSAAPPEDLALLAELLSLPVDERLFPVPASAQRRREHTFSALLRQLTGAALRDPVLVIFEDAHWADPSSLEFLDHLVASLSGRRMLVVVSHRPEFSPYWAGLDITLVALARLGPRDGASLVRGMTRTELPDALIEDIVARTDGVPLFVEELTKAILEFRGDPRGKSENASSPALAVPASLHASLLARLDRLGPSARNVAQVGSAIGRDFPHDLLASVSDLRPSDLDAALGLLVGAGLLFRREIGSTITYQFKHALVRDSAYGTMLRERRRSTHARIADALRERATGTAPELLAHHLTAAGEFDAAVRQWLAAGRSAADRSADREAVGHLQRGLELLARLPPDEHRDRLDLDFQLAIGTPLIALHGWSGKPVAVAYERASELCERLGEDSLMVRSLFGLASNRIVRGQTRVALSLAERCRVSAERSGNPVDFILAHRALGAARMQLGELRRARVEFEEVVRLYDPERDRGLAARCVTDPHASGLSLLALLLWIMGYVRSAAKIADQAATSAVLLDHANTTGHLLCFGEGARALISSDMPAARRAAGSLLELATEHAMPMWRGYGLAMLGWCVALDDAPDEGAELLRKGIDELDALGTSFHRTHHLTLLARVEALRGDLAAGHDVLRRAQEEIAQTDIRLFEAEVCRADGDLHLIAGRPLEAERRFRIAMHVACGQEARSFELRAAVSLGQLLRQQGREAEARQVLLAASAHLPEQGVSNDLTAAEELLRALKDPGLTRRLPH